MLFPFYDLLERQIPFGQAAILCAKPKDLLLLQEQAARLGVPLTLEGGVPLKKGTLLPGDAAAAAPGAGVVVRQRLSGGGPARPDGGRAGRASRGGVFEVFAGKACGRPARPLFELSGADPT